MWRSNVFPENENSDQSISEDDDLNEELLEDLVSLGNPSEIKGEVQILSQLDRLRDANEVAQERNQTSLPHKICVEDDVEFPVFGNKDEVTYRSWKASACNSDEEILSDNEVTGNCMQLSKCFTSEADNNQKLNPFSSGGNINGVCTWLAENAEADALVSANDYSDFSFQSLSSKLKSSSKGGQNKTKPKFSIRRQSDNDNVCKDLCQVYESHTSFKGKEMDGMTNHMMVAGFPVSHAHSTTSMAELFLRVQDEHAKPEGSTLNVAHFNKTEGKSKEQAVKRNILSMGHCETDDDPDCLDSDSSEENEHTHQLQELIMPESKQKTIADQFHEALGAACTNEEGPMYAVPHHKGFGLFGKLQRVMRSEKEKDSIFLNNLQKEDEASCLDVKILSTALEGKLTVCLCSFIENDEGSTCTDNPLNIIERKNMTIIFSSRICTDVELDVGSLKGKMLSCKSEHKNKVQVRDAALKGQGTSNRCSSINGVNPKHLDSFWRFVYSNHRILFPQEKLS